MDTDLARRLSPLRHRAFRAAVYAPMLAPAPLLIHFFSPFPHGWDQAEYSWCLAAGYLPHSPYILHTLAGHLLTWIAEPASALSALSVGSGLLSVGLLIFVTRWLTTRLVRAPANEPAPALVSLSAAATYGLSPLFVHQASIQEVYAMQAALLLASLALLLAPLRHREALAGALFGAALGTHNGSVLAGPALAFLIWSPGGRPRVRALAAWAGAAAVAYAAVVLFVAVVLPDDPTRGRLSQLIDYLHGVAAGFRWDTLASWTRLERSLTGLTLRLFTLGMVPPWLESEPTLRGDPFLVGAALLRGGAVAMGVVSLARRAPRAMVFWILWAAPFLLYELLLGETVDPGAYLPFVLPAVAVFIASSVETVARALPHTRRAAHVLALTWLAVLLAPSAVRFSEEWNEPVSSAAAHFTPVVLAAAWMANNLPDDAVVVGPRLPLNPNVVPYYSRRRPIILPDRLPMLLRDPRPFTPLNLGSFEPVTTETLARLIGAGIPVFAFEDRPIARREGDAAFDPDAFRWVPALRVDVRAVAAALAVPEAVRAAITQDRVVLYRAERAGKRGVQPSALRVLRRPGLPSRPRRARGDIIGRP